VMWASLQATHQDSTAGGWMYWLRDLVQAKMTGINIRTHITKMNGYAERLNALINPGHPLTANDIHSPALLILVPSDWLHCVSALMNEENVTSTCIVLALLAKDLCRKACGEDPSNLITVVRVDRSLSSTSPQAPLLTKYYCTFCKCTGHNDNTDDNT
jgi:hypothetical protein